MSQCHSVGSCHGCCRGFDRRGFLKSCGIGAAALAASSWRPGVSPGSPDDAKSPRVAAVFLSSMNTNEIWPYPGFDTKGRQDEVLAMLRDKCSGVEFVPVTVASPVELPRALSLNGEVDGYLVYVMTLDWAQSKEIADIALLKRPTLLVDEFLGGCGSFLTTLSGLRVQGIPVAAVSTVRMDDIVTVARVFRDLKRPGMTAASFARKCEDVYRTTFAAGGELKCIDDTVPLTGIAECVEKLRNSRFLIVGAGQSGTESDFLGATGRYIGFDELQALYEQADPERAREWSDRWSQKARTLTAGDYVEPSRPASDALPKAGGVYLAMLALMKKYGTQSVTMNCLGGFAAGQLPAYPCLGFMQILNDGGQGVCEAMPDDTVSMLMARILTGRPGFVSDPALDTSKNQVVYAHCVGTTKVFGPAGAENDYRIRTLHNRDPRGACSESFLPGGYMTTSFRTNVARKQLIVHQAKALGTLETERGCRTKLVGEVRGDIGKLFHYWSQFGWHRVTVYGDVKEPLSEFGRALGLEVIEEA